MLRDLAPLLLEEGYVLRVFDLIDFRHSDAFNPFAYIRDAKDVMKLVNNLLFWAAGAGGVTLSRSDGFTQAARPGWYGEE